VMVAATAALSPRENGRDESSWEEADEDRALH
jgi:hypothetical protein